tara:strand:+ start:514 stop:951 length:438 start_codon:yes stop_codon:yes gene_type:complete
MSSINYFFEKTPRFRYGLPPKKWIKNCLAYENKHLGVLNFIFCSDKYLQKVNKKYLNKSYLTDVISFKNEPPIFEKNRPKNHVYGDIFISIDRVKENKKTYKTIFVTELKRVMIHGVLHLIGFKDSSEEEKKMMRKKENTYIKIL